MQHARPAHGAPCHVVRARNRAKPAPEQLWTVGHVQQQQSCQSECQLCQAKSTGTSGGKEERGEQPLSEGDEGVTVIPCAGPGEERKESATARGGTTPNLSGTERLGTLL